MTHVTVVVVTALLACVCSLAGCGAAGSDVAEAGQDPRFRYEYATSGPTVLDWTYLLTDSETGARWVVVRTEKGEVSIAPYGEVEE